MRDLGHHEFGADFRPIDFDGWMGPARRRPDPAMWMEYWTAAYRYALRVAEPGVVFVDHNVLGPGPGEGVHFRCGAAGCCRRIDTDGGGPLLVDPHLPIGARLRARCDANRPAREVLRVLPL